MINQPAKHQQLDLLVFTADAIEPSRICRAIRGEVTALLKLLMSEHIAERLALPHEAADE